MPPTDGAAQKRERIAIRAAAIRDMMSHTSGGPITIDASFLRETGDMLAALLGAAPSGEPDPIVEAYESVMEALDTALDGDSMYSQDPAELVWRLRNQRDEALAGAAPAEREGRETLKCTGCVQNYPVDASGMHYAENPTGGVVLICPCAAAPREQGESRIDLSGGTVPGGVHGVPLEPTAPREQPEPEVNR